MKKWHAGMLGIGAGYFVAGYFNGPPLPASAGHVLCFP